MISVTVIASEAKQSRRRWTARVMALQCLLLLLFSYFTLQAAVCKRCLPGAAVAAHLSAQAALTQAIVAFNG